MSSRGCDRVLEDHATNEFAHDCYVDDGIGGGNPENRTGRPTI
jgi:hypothetical protein